MSFAPPTKDELKKHSSSDFAPVTEDEIKKHSGGDYDITGRGLLKGALEALPIAGGMAGVCLFHVKPGRGSPTPATSPAFKTFPAFSARLVFYSDSHLLRSIFAISTDLSVRSFAVSLLTSINF